MYISIFHECCPTHFRRLQTSARLRFQGEKHALHVTASPSHRKQPRILEPLNNNYMERFTSVPDDVSYRGGRKISSLYVWNIGPPCRVHSSARIGMFQPTSDRSDHNDLSRDSVKPFLTCTPPQPGGPTKYSTRTAPVEIFAWSRGDVNHRKQRVGGRRDDDEKFEGMRSR